jgi:hypothetical protein
MLLREAAVQLALRVILANSGEDCVFFSAQICTGENWLPVIHKFFSFCRRTPS